MTAFTMTFDTGNAAFERNLANGIADVLRTLADQIDLYGVPTGENEDSGIVRDVNGNTIGGWLWSPGGE